MLFPVLRALTIFGLAMAVCTVSAEQAPPRSSWYVSAGPAFGQVIIGSEDTRRGQAYAVGRVTYSRGLSSSHVPGYMVTELTYNSTRGGGFEDIPGDQLRIVGLQVAARWHPTWLANHKVYAQIGLGITYADHTTRDLDSSFNTAPFVAVGATWPLRGDRAVVEVRFWHVSNGGTVGNNQGMNQLQFLFGVQF